MGSLLPIANRVLSVDERTTFLAHYDLNENDVLKGIKPVGTKNAYYFPGNTSSFGMIPHNDSYLADKTTIMWWVYPVSWNNGVTVSMLCKRDNVMNGFFFFKDSGTSTITLDWGGSANRWNTGYLPPTNTWTHLAYTYDGAIGRFYVNGTLTASTGTLGDSSKVKIGSWGLYIGRDGMASQYPLNGSINGIKIFNRALPENEIKDNMGGKDSEKGLLGHWPLNEGNGSIIRDLSVFRHDGTLNGAGTWSYGNSVFTLREREGYFGGGIIIDEQTENLIGNGHFANGAGIVNESGSGPINEIVKMPNPGDSEWVLRQTDSDGGSAEYEIHTKDGRQLKKNTTYTMSCWVAYSSDYNGADQIFHSRWYYADGTNAISGTAGTLEKTVEINGLVWQKRYQSFTTANKDMGTTPYNWYLGYNPANTTGYRYLTNVQLEEKDFATSFVDGTRPSGEVSYPISIMNYEEGTISFWMKLPRMLPYIPSEIHGYMATGRSYNGTAESLSFCKYSGDYTDRILGIHWPTQDGIQNHKFFLYTNTPSFVNGEWNMITVSWNANVGYKIYINGALQAYTEIASGKKLMNWTSDRLTFRNMGVDELRIDSIQRTDDEIMAWYQSNSPFWPRGIYRKA